MRRGTPTELAHRLNEPPPEGPQRFERILEQLGSDVLPFISNNDHPGYFAYVPGAGIWPGALGDLIASACNLKVSSWVQAAGPSQVELVVLGWFKQWIGYPEQAAGVLVSGGSAANLTALACGSRKPAPLRRSRSGSGSPAANGERRRSAASAPAWRHAALGQMVGRATAGAAAFHDAVALQRPQPLRQQAARDTWSTLEELPERLAAAQEVADDDRCPPLGVDLGAAGDRAVLAVALHGPSIARLPPPGSPVRGLRSHPLPCGATDPNRNQRCGT
jgi:pyridoxal-dependent decarboxylase-like protein